MTPLPVLFFALAVLSLAAPVAAKGASIDESIVYVECKTPDQLTRLGSGVMISSDGALLTAKHVVFGKADSLPPGTVCKGVVGDAGLAMATLTFVKRSQDYDAVVMRMPAPAGASFKAVHYCRLGPELLRAQIFATGFPLPVKESVEFRQTRPSSRGGVLATVQPNGLGIIETDTQTTTGMSGGMVTLGLSSTLVGIVASLETDNNGIPKTYRVLAAEVLADEFENFGLTEADPKHCPLSRVTENVLWESDNGPKLLGIKKSEGICFLTHVFGLFDALQDEVKVEHSKEFGYSITGTNSEDPLHGGAAQCMRF